MAQALQKPELPKAERVPPGREPVVSFRCMPPALKKSLIQFAGNIDFPVGVAARLLLEFGIEEVQAGSLALKPQMSWKGWTLYPDWGNRSGRPNAAFAHKGEKTISVTFRGIPDGVTQALTQICAANHAVPVGEVARRFFEHGLALYHQNLLIIPEPGEWLSGVSPGLKLVQKAVQ